MKKIQVMGGNRKEAVKGIFKSIGVEAKIEKIRRSRRNEEREMLLVKLGNEEQKKEVLKKKRNLKGRRERII